MILKSARSKTKYRPDIDGMRAIAVLSVVIFHFSKGLLPGGYLGVDIFFVISGFLITSIIYGDMQSATFSVLNFYNARVRRIMPALLVMLISVTIVCSLILLPSDLVGYGKSLVSTLAFSANIYFWRDTDYFAAGAETKPLLHMWSLGVEEQFYIFFPYILLAIARFNRAWALPAVATLAAGALFLNGVALHIGGASPAFFLLPTRAWELCLGALIALAPENQAIRWLWMNELLSALGLALVFIALIAPIEQSSWIPAAVPAVLGSAMIIVTGRLERPVVNRLLTLLPLVYVGSISYSLYIWHWPIIVLAKYYLVRELDPLEMVAAGLLIFVLASASLHFVERPFRQKMFPIRPILISSAALVAALSTIAAAFIITDGLPNRLSPAAAEINAAVGTHFRCPVSRMIPFGSSRACELNLPDRDPRHAELVLLGNSHAQMYAPLVEEIIGRRNRQGLLVPLNGCLPTVSSNIDIPCLQAATRNFEAVLALPNVKIVVLAFTWWEANVKFSFADGRILLNTNNSILVSAVDDLIERLRAAGKVVVLVGPVAQPGWEVASVVSREIAFGRAIDRPTYLDSSEFNKLFGATIEHFDHVPGIEFVKPHTAQCIGGRCEYIRDGRALFADGGHIAASALPLFRGVFESGLERALARIPE